MLEQLELWEKAYILVKLLPFVIPMMNADEIELSEPIIIQIHPDIQKYTIKRTAERIQRREIERVLFSQK